MALVGLVGTPTRGEGGRAGLSGDSDRERGLRGLGSDSGGGGA